MPRIFPVIKKVTVVQGGDVPAGASVMSDAVSLFARVTLPESLDGQTDAIATAIAAAYAETGASPTEALKAGLSGYLDSSAAPTDSLAATSYTWSTSAVGSGTAPTNPTNANGSNNGTLANCKAAGLPTVVPSTLTLTIPRANVPNTGTYTFRAYYRTNAGVADTFTLTYAQTGGTPATIDLPDGNFLTTPHDTVLTSLHATNTITVTVTHNATVAATGGSIDVDAVGIRTMGAF